MLRRMQEETIAKGKKVVYVFSGPREILWTKESIGLGNEEERNTISFGKISNESV